MSDKDAQVKFTLVNEEPTGGGVPPEHLIDPVFMMTIYNKQIREGAIKLYNWQMKVMMKFAMPSAQDKVSRIAVVAANGSGKSQYLIAPCATWLAMRFPRARSVVTSSSGTQLDRQTGSSINHICQQVNKLHKKPLWKINYRFYTYLPTGSTIEMFATDEPGLAEGYHPHLGGKEFAFFCDEGKTIPPEIYTAIERCNGMTRRMDVSSPGAPLGHFYDVFNDDSGRWWPLRVTYKDCPHVKEDEVEEFAARHGGRNSPYFRSAYLAEFTSVDEETVIKFHTVNEQYKNPPETVLFGKRFAGGDIGAGGDESTFAVFEGNRQLGMEAWNLSDTTRTADHLEFLIKDKYKLDPEEVNIDDGGVSKAVIDMLHRRGLMVNRVINQAAAIRKDLYANRGAEMWWHFSNILPELVLLDDSVLKTQLCNRYYRRQLTTGRLLLESKKEARAKGHGSPDRADAVILAFSRKPSPYVAGMLDDSALEKLSKRKTAALSTNEMIDAMDKRKYGEIPLFEKSADGISNNRVFSSLDHILAAEVNKYNFS